MTDTTSIAVGEASRRHLGTVARGGALGLVGAFVAGISGFVLVAVIARGLPADRAGVFFAVTATFLVVEALAGLGTDTGLGRFLLRHEASGNSAAVLSTVRATLFATVSVAVLLGLTLAVSAGPIARAFGWGDAGVAPLRIVACVLPAAVATDLCLSATRAFGQMRSTVVVDRILRAGLQPVLVVTALAFGGGLVEVTLGWAASHLLAAALSTVALRRLLARRGYDGWWGARAPAPGVLAEFWSFTWLRGVARVAQIGMQKVDILLVAALVSLEAAAVYTVATRFVPLGQMATQAIQQVLQPRFTAILVHDDRRTLAEVYRVSTAWSMLLSWPLHLTVLGLAAGYLRIFGQDMPGAQHAVAVVVVMALTMMVAVASGPVDTLLLMTGRSRASAFNAFTALTIDVVLCLLLLPRFGILGAAIAWSAAVVTRCGLAFWQVRRTLGVQPLAPVTCWAALLPTVCLGIPLGLLGQGTNDPTLLIAGLVVCVVAYGVGVRHFRSRLALDDIWSALMARRTAVTQRRGRHVAQY